MKQIYNDNDDDGGGVCGRVCGGGVWTTNGVTIRIRQMYDRVNRNII